MWALAMVVGLFIVFYAILRALTKPFLNPGPPPGWDFDEDDAADWPTNRSRYGETDRR